MELIQAQDYLRMLKLQFEERQLFKYPPFYRLIKVVVKHKNVETVDRAAKQLADLLKQNKKLIILGPEFPLISRIQLWHQKEIWIKLNRKLNPEHIKSIITSAVEHVKSFPANSSCQVHIDVDPY